MRVTIAVLLPEARRPEALTRALWGDWHFAAKEKRVVRLKPGGGGDKAKTMFVQFALEPVWKVRRECVLRTASVGWGRGIKER